MGARTSTSMRLSLGPARRQWTRLFALGSVLVVSMIMMTSSAAAATHATSQLHPPFKGGTVSPSYIYYDQAGCGSLTVVKPWSVSLHSGSWKGYSKGSASVCSNADYNHGVDLGTSGLVYSDSLYDVGIPVKVPSSDHRVTVSMNASWNYSIASTDGGNPACIVNGNAFDDTTYNAQWNYSPTSGSYGKDNYSSWSEAYDPSVPYWSNYTQGSGPLPQPWHFNNSTSFSWTHSWGGSWSCSATAEVYLDAQAYLVDQTNGTYIGASVNGVGASGILSHYYVETENSTSWTCSNSTVWTGPSGTWTNATVSCSTQNATVTTYLCKYWTGSSATCSTNSANSGSFVSLSSMSGSWVFDYSYKSHHSYILVMTLLGFGRAQDDWPGLGAAGFSLNMATAGHRFLLSSIVLT